MPEEHKPENKGWHASKITRRRFIQAGLAGALATIPGDNHQQPPVSETTSRLNLPADLDGDMQKRFHEAEQEMNQAIELASHDLLAIKKRHGLLDIGKVRSGVILGIVPPRGSKKASCEYHFGNSPSEKYNLEGVAAMLDAAVRLERLYDEANRHDGVKEPQTLSYRHVSEKLLRRYQQLSGDRFDEQTMNSLTFLARCMMETSMDDVMCYDCCERNPHELNAANHRFLDMMERFKDRAWVIDDRICHVPHSIPVIMLTQEEYDKQKGAVMIQNRLRETFGGQLPVPDHDTLKRACCQPLTKAQQAFVSLVENRHSRLQRPELVNTANLPFSGPLGLGSMNVEVTIEVKNPTLHTNRHNTDLSQHRR